MNHRPSAYSPPGPPEFGCCYVCGKPIKDEVHYVWPRHPHLTHSRCRPWHTQPFPFDERLRRLRRIARLLKTAYKHVLAAGKQLAALERGWPPEDATDAVSAAEKAWNKLESVLARLRDALRL